MIQIDHLTRTFNAPKGPIVALDDIDLEIKKGEFVVINGKSGCGKTTLLMTIAGLLHPTRGRVAIDGQKLNSMSQAQCARLRARYFGFVFQQFYLIPYLDTLENVMLGGISVEKNRKIRLAKKILESVGLSERLYHRPGRLSSGENQRAAIARALYSDPPIILADEPTGNLDPDNAHNILQYLSQYNKKGNTILLVTHTYEAKDYADRVLTMNQGQIENIKTTNK